MRLFIAVELTSELKDYLKRQQEAIQGYCYRGHFSRPENLHLTVRFLGDVEKERLKAIYQAMDEAVQKKRPFSLQLEGWGHFARGEKKLLWVGLEGELRQLYQLFWSLEETLATKGFPKEGRKLKPHITMAREVLLKNDWEEIIRQERLEPEQWPVNGITLMESTRINGLLTYKPLYYSAFHKSKN